MAHVGEVALAYKQRHDAAKSHKHTKDDEVASADAGHAGREAICRETLNIRGLASGTPYVFAIDIPSRLTEGIDFRYELVASGNHSCRARGLV